MQKARKMSHSTQRKRVMNRHKIKINSRRLTQFMQESQDTASPDSSSLS